GQVTEVGDFLVGGNRQDVFTQTTPHLSAEDAVPGLGVLILGFLFWCTTRKDQGDVVVLGNLLQAGQERGDDLGLVRIPHQGIGALYEHRCRAIRSFDSFEDSINGVTVPTDGKVADWCGERVESHPFESLSIRQFGTVSENDEVWGLSSRMTENTSRIRLAVKGVQYERCFAGA